MSYVVSTLHYNELTLEPMAQATLVSLENIKSQVIKDNPKLLENLCPKLLIESCTNLFKIQ